MAASTALRIGDVAPNFSGKSSVGDFDFYHYKTNSWGILFSHPKDFTPVCTTELGELQRKKPEFEKRNVKLVGLSVDTADSHSGWVKDINEVNKVTVDYPIFADSDRKVAQLYNMLDQTNLDAPGLPLTVRSVFVIDPNHKIRLILTYPASCGRNFDELVRVIDSLQLTDRSKVVTPANWKPGDDVIISPAVSNDQAKELFGEFHTVKPYLRFVKASQIKS